MTFWILIAVGTVLEVLGDALFKADKWTLGSISYGSGAAFWAWSLRYETLSVAIVAFAVLNILLAVAVGHWYFDESLNAKQWIGLGLGVGCIALLAS